MLRGKRQIAFLPHRFSVDAHIAILVSGITAAGKIRKEAAMTLCAVRAKRAPKHLLKIFTIHRPPYVCLSSANHGRNIPFMEIIVVCGTIIRMAKQRKILEIYPIKGH